MSGHVVTMLERYLTGEVSGSELERWADAIEGRDAIAYDPIVAVLLKQVIFELANPTIQGPTTPASARAWISRLGTGSARG